MTLFIKNALYITVVPATVAVYLPLTLMHGRTAASAEPFFIALVLLGIGSAIIVKSVWDFAIAGDGTPFPVDPPTKLVVRGLYRYTRNPIYIGILSIILGWAVMYQSRMLFLYAFYTALFFQGFIILYEERHLRRIFGDEYKQYCAAVNRWFPTIMRKLPIFDDRSNEP